MANTTKIVYDGRTYTGTEIQNGNMRLATSLLSSSLESNTFNVTLKSPNKNLTNFSRNAPITVFNGERQLGIFYVRDVKRTAADLHKVSATSAVGILSDGNHYGGIYTGQTAESIIGSICGSVKYDNIMGKLDKLIAWQEAEQAAPKKRWDSIKDKAIWAVLAAVIAFLLGRIGL